MERLPDTPAGRQAAWFLHHANAGGRELTLDEIAEHMSFPEPWTPQGSLERFRADQSPPQITKVNEISPHEITVHLADATETLKPVVITVHVAEEPPHRIIRLDWVRDVGEGVVIREALESEGPILADLERRAPIIIDSASITYDRGDDFFAFARLMEENVSLVAVDHGEIAALNCATLHRVVIGGKEYHAMLLHHSRVPKDHQRKGLFSPLNVRAFNMFQGRMDAAYAYVAAGNTTARRLSGPDSWSFPALRGVLRCETLAGPPVGRSATPADAGRIVEILNGCHQGEAMYLPYTVDSFTARLKRAPELYSWDRVWLTDRAVVGVWPAGLKVTREEGGVRTESVRASALDHGFLPGAEDEFESLLRAWCGWLAERGTTELALYTSEGSPNYRVVKSLASQIDVYDFRMGVPEPDDAAEHGLYVDAVYF
jgi:hypothetical protein